MPTLNKLLLLLIIIIIIIIIEQVQEHLFTLISHAFILLP